MDKSADLYETDFFCWTAETAALLRAGKLEQLDLEHIAEEIEDMGRRDKREVQSRMIVLITHLIKWKVQPERKGKSWALTILDERRELSTVFKQSPSLRRYAREKLAELRVEAITRASLQTGISEARCEPACDFTLDQILDPGFLPE